LICVTRRNIILLTDHARGITYAVKTSTGQNTRSIFTANGTIEIHTNAYTIRASIIRGTIIVIIASSAADIHVNTSSGSWNASGILTFLGRAWNIHTGTYTIIAGIICGTTIVIMTINTIEISVNTSGSRIASGILTLIWGACDTSTVAYTIGAGIICGT